MLNCKEVSRLVSLSQEKPLSFSEKVSLKFHLFMCKKCKDFNNNIQSLRTMMRNFAETPDNVDPPNTKEK